MAQKTTRRRFLQTTTVASVGYWATGGVQAQESTSPNQRIAMASIGIGNKGSSDSTDAGRFGDLVAICDPDKKYLEGIGRKFPKAKRYTDFRKMLDEMGGSIDAVTVSTPDHNHAPIALMAMRMGKHCFCQKPLTRSIYEARLMGKVAREMKVVTQMGNQGTAHPGLRESAALLRAGALGTVKEVHVWTNRPVWPQGAGRPQSEDTPESLDWENWIGVAPMRPFAKGYHPFTWRGYWDFGTGALGDMACHTVNMPFMGLDLRNPTAVQAVTSGHNGDSYPKWSIINFDFPANDWRPAIKFVWYDGGKRPDREILEGKKMKKAGCLVVGEKAKLYSVDDYGKDREIIGDVELPKVEYRRPRGSHFSEWVDAIKGGEPATSNFPDYAGPLTETILLGNLAVWPANEGEGPRVEWDSKNLKASVDGLDRIIKPVYRNEYVLDV